jgi:putative ABC transport system permease protein
LASALGATGVSAQVYALSSSFDDKTRQSLWVLGGAVGFLFLVVCANVANLALSRSLLRTRVYAIRSALGASRADLVREALVEHTLLAAVGCAAGIGIALGFVRLAKTVLPDAMTLQAFTPIAIDWRAAALAAALGTVAVLVGLPAAILGSRPSVQALIGAGARGTTSSAMARRLRASLVVLEICVSTALLVGAALMTRSLLKLEGADRGFDTTNLISIRLGLPGATYRAPGQSDRFVADAVRQLRATPGVTMATLGDLPMNSRPYMLGPVEFSSEPHAFTPPLIIPMLAVPPDYFQAMGLRLVSGRTFSPADGDDTVVVSEGFAKAHWPGGQAIGGAFRRESQSWQTVIGVVGDVRPLSADSWQRGQGVYYQTGHAPEAMRPVSSVSSIAEYRTLVVRSSQPARTVEALPQVIHAVDPQVVVARIALVDHLYADAIARPRTVFLLMTVFAVVGLTLAMAGVYGVLSHLVTQRLREIGIRLALGARPGDVGRAVVGSGIGLGALGLVSGLGLAFALVRVVRALLYDVNPSDPLSLGLVAAVLAVTSIAASWIPARRAMRVDPVALLRED